MRHFLKFLRVRRRDAIYFVFVWLFSVISLLCAMYCAYFAFVLRPDYERRFESASGVVSNYLAECHASILVYSSALDSLRSDLSQFSSSGSSSSSSSVDTNLVLVGRGSVRLSSGRLLPYEDIRLSDGQVERRYQR